MESYNVLFLGDSWADSRHASSAFEDACASATVKHVSVGGTTASMWATGSLLKNGLDDLAEENFVPDFAWVSLGGNDFMYNLCLPFGGVDSIAADILTVVERLEQEFPDIQRILLTGYALNPIFVLRPCAFRMRSVYTDYDYTARTKVVVIDELFGGVLSDSETRPSDFKFFSDPIHLNREGYDLLFGYEPVAQALGCLSGSLTSDPSTPVAKTAPPSTMQPQETRSVAPVSTTTAPSTRRTFPPTVRPSTEMPTGSPTSSPTSTSPSTVLPNILSEPPTLIGTIPLNTTESPTGGPENTLVSPLDGDATSGANLVSEFGGFIIIVFIFLAR